MADEMLIWIGTLAVVVAIIVILVFSLLLFFRKRRIDKDLINEYGEKLVKKQRRIG